MLKAKDTAILIGLALPLIASGLVEASVGFTSTIFLSHLGDKTLAVGSLVAWFFATLMIILWGIFTAVSVEVSNCQGSKDTAKIAYVVRDGFWLAIILTIPTTFLIWNMAPLLKYLGQSNELVSLAIPYLHSLSWSVLPDFIGLLLLQLVIGLGQTRTNLVFTLSWVILNILANYAFIFGHFGLPAFGIAGLGWSTAFSFWISTLAWCAYLISRPYYRPYFTKLITFKQPYYIWELIKVGLPSGLMWCIEITFFLVLALMIGHISVNLLAASQVAMQYIGLFVAILFSIAQAVTIRVSYCQGAKDSAGTHTAVQSGILFAFCIMTSLAGFAWIFPEYLIKIDFNQGTSHSQDIMTYAKIFLRIGVIFLMLEAIRITLFGALRGLKDTQSTLLGSFLSFWVVAIPAGYLFAYPMQLGVIGLYLGLLCSGFVGTSFLWWRYNRVRTWTAVTLL